MRITGGVAVVGIVLWTACSSPAKYSSPGSSAGPCGASAFLDSEGNCVENGTATDAGPTGVTGGDAGAGVLCTDFANSTPQTSVLFMSPISGLPSFSASTEITNTSGCTFVNASATAVATSVSCTFTQNGNSVQITMADSSRPFAEGMAYTYDLVDGGSTGTFDVGVYDSATSGGGDWCGTSGGSGSFAVSKVAYSSSGLLDQLTASFVINCPQTAVQVTGCIYATN